MMQPDLPDDAPAGRREYAFAKAYTEARQRQTGRFLPAEFCAFLILLLTPLGYGGLMPLFSDDLTADWFRAWIEATAGLSRLLKDMLPGLATSSQLIYDDDPRAMDAFLHFASVDTLCVFGMLLLFFGFTSTLHRVPKQGGPQHEALQKIAKGFPLPFGFGGGRVGGAAGGLGVALAFALLGFGLAAGFYFQPALDDGAIFRGAHFYCLDWYEILSRRRRCTQYGEYDLVQTIWKLGWKSSLATLIVPACLWTGIVSLHYPFWLLAGRPSRH
jgi:hypothetical protein